MRGFRLAAWIVLLVLPWTGQALAQGASGMMEIRSRPGGVELRIALVIGNGAYPNMSPLKNPVNDARLISTTSTRSKS